MDTLLKGFQVLGVLLLIGFVLLPWFMFDKRNK